MSGAAIVMMVVALVLVWGGLVVALLHLRRHPEEADEDTLERSSLPPST